MLPKATVFTVVGLGFGDEGKGTTIDYLARAHGATSVVCFTGGPQKAHHVVDPNGNWHCFSQFGSATLIPGVKTHISSRTLFKPDNLLFEALALKRNGVLDALSRLSIDPKSYIVTSLHGLIGQLLEISRGDNRLGSVGMGVGQAVLDRRKKGRNALVARDLFNRAVLRAKLEDLWDEKISFALDLAKENPTLLVTLEKFLSANSVISLVDAYSEFARFCPNALISDQDFLEDAINRSETIILEAGQGALLDPTHGFVPYVTKTPTTSSEAELLLDPWKDRVEHIKVGALRAYGHRHGAGPFVTFDSIFTSQMPEAHNQTNPWQGEFLCGWFDLPATLYAISLNPGLEFVSLTCVDRLGLGVARICTSYEYIGSERDKLDAYFIWDQIPGNRIRITGFKKLDFPSEERTILLFQCKPLDIEEIEVGEVLHFVSTLQEKLGIPIGILSTGPTADHKTNLREIP